MNTQVDDDIESESEWEEGAEHLINRTELDEHGPTARDIESTNRRTGINMWE
jgi:hypothetical protein